VNLGGNARLLQTLLKWFRLRTITEEGDRDLIHINEFQDAWWRSGYTFFDKESSFLAAALPTRGFSETNPPRKSRESHQAIKPGGLPKGGDIEVNRQRDNLHGHPDRNRPRFGHRCCLFVAPELFDTMGDSCGYSLLVL
jgi:hypothetical protein